MDYPAPMVEGQRRRGRSGRRAGALAALAIAVLTVTGCGGGSDKDPAERGAGIALAARLPSDNALYVTIADVAGIRKTLDMPKGAIPPTDDDETDLAFLREVDPALGILQSGTFPQSVVDEALSRSSFVASVAGDEGVTAFTISGDSSDFEPLLTQAGLTEDGDEWVADDDEFSIALGEGLVVFADDPGDAGPVVENDDADPPEELDQLDGDGELITFSKAGADCIKAVATTDTPGENGEVAFFTTATPDPSKITGAGVNEDRTRIENDSARVSIPRADEVTQEPPAFTALQNFSLSYDCDA